MPPVSVGDGSTLQGNKIAPASRKSLLASYCEYGRPQEFCVPFWQSHMNISLNDERGIRTGLNINKGEESGGQVQSTRIRLLKIILTKSLFLFNGCQLCRGIRSPRKRGEGEGEDVLSKLQIQVYCLVILFLRSLPTKT